MSKAAQLEREMPASRDAEVATLAAILLDPSGEAYHQAASRLLPEFSSENFSAHDRNL